MLRKVKVKTEFYRDWWEKTRESPYSEECPMQSLRWESFVGELHSRPKTGGREKML